MGRINLTEIESYFEKLTFSHLSSCVNSFDSGDYLSSAVWAAVFIEALLKDILHEIDSYKGEDELSTMISKLKKLSGGFGSSLKNKELYKDVAVRCNEIRGKRNRLLHDTGVKKSGIEIDAADINNNVIIIVEQYIQTGAAKNIKNKNQQAAAPKGVPQTEPTFPIFISSITPHTREQEVFLNSFCERLKEIGVKPVRCLFTDFDKKDPMGKVRSEIEKCNALIVIGLERSHVYFYRDKEGSENETENIHRKCTSGWLQIESGMAIALGKPVFVLCQKDIHSDGIFDRYWNSYTPIEVDAPLDINHPNVSMMLEKIKEFVENYKN